MQIFIILFLPFEGFGERIEGTWLDGLSQTSVKLDNCVRGPSKNNMAPWPARPAPSSFFHFHHPQTQPRLTAIDSSTLFCYTLFPFSLPFPKYFFEVRFGFFSCSPFFFFVKCQIFADSFDSLSKCARNFC